jgi:hypothetical protein
MGVLAASAGLRAASSSLRQRTSSRLPAARAPGVNPGQTRTRRDDAEQLYRTHTRAGQSSCCSAHGMLGGAARSAAASASAATAAAPASPATSAPPVPGAASSPSTGGGLEAMLSIVKL